MKVVECYDKLLSLPITEEVKETGIYFLTALLYDDQEMPTDIYLDRGDHLVLECQLEDRKLVTRITGLCIGETIIHFPKCTTQQIPFNWK